MYVLGICEKYKALVLRISDEEKFVLTPAYTYEGVSYTADKSCTDGCTVH